MSSIVKQLRATIQEQEYTILLLRAEVVKLQAKNCPKRKKRKVSRG